MAAAPFEFSEHAAVEMVKRQIRPEWVGRVLAAPERTEADRRDGALRHALARVPEFGDRVLRVVYNERTVPWRVVTLYFDRRARL